MAMFHFYVQLKVLAKLQVDLLTDNVFVFSSVFALETECSNVQWPLG